MLLEGNKLGTHKGKTLRNRSCSVNTVVNQIILNWALKMGTFNNYLTLLSYPIYLLLLMVVHGGNILVWQVKVIFIWLMTSTR